jgi:hypothetical protein
MTDHDLNALVLSTLKEHSAAYRGEGYILCACGFEARARIQGKGSGFRYRKHLAWAMSRELKESGYARAS